MCRDHKQFDFDAMKIRRMLLLVDNEIKCHIRVQHLEYSRFQENSKNSVVQKFWAIKYHVKFLFDLIHWFRRSLRIKSQVLFIDIDMAHAQILMGVNILCIIIYIRPQRSLFPRDDRT